MEPKEDRPSLANICELCGDTGTSKCSRCQTTYYCSKQHQMHHWSDHKKDCKKRLLHRIPVPTYINQPSTSTILSSADNRDPSSLASESVKSHSRSFANKLIGASRNVNLIHKCTTIHDFCINVIKHLNGHGICVFDEFMGQDIANRIFKEVKNLYKKGKFQKGQLVNPKPSDPDGSIRSDVITWVTGVERECKSLQRFLQKMDIIINTCTIMPNNGLISQHKLYSRTKVMIACYPGNGTHYKKHIDNPQKDGRCVSCVYYLNRNWDMQKHGGLLRLYPSVGSTCFDVEPIFDRVVLFWSDRRNPHEVLPVFATRFAITVWYFDNDERKEALKVAAQKS